MLRHAIFHRLRPLQARVYGACVATNYENIERNMCQKEFLAFKACVQQKVSVSFALPISDGLRRIEAEHLG